MPQEVPSKRALPIIRLFVSSTFSDLKHERNALHAEVFPKLELLCQKNGFQFQAIDLRWGVSTEAGLDHRTMRICFDELRRAQKISPKPNFLILLGNRYGWRPLPEEISMEEFHTLEQAAAQIVGSTNKSAVTVLREWYREDANAVPPVYLLRSRRQDLGDGQDYMDDTVWNQVQAVLWAIVNRAMPLEHLPRRFDMTAPDGSPPAIVRFQASATEQEIWHGALRVPNACEHVLFFSREIENLGEFDPKQIMDFVDVDQSGSLEIAFQTEQDCLKQVLGKRLGSANVFSNKVPARLVEAQDNLSRRSVDVTTDHLDQLCVDVVSRMSQIIQGQIDEYWRKTDHASTDRAALELEIEQREYERFADERGGEKSFVGRQVELQAILDYVSNDSRFPLVIHGASGCGKTALLARASQEVAKTRKRFERFIGVAPRSSDIRSLLSSLCQELRQRNPRTDTLPNEIKELRDEFSQHLQAATPEQPLILFLDALDQLADVYNGRLLNWLPSGIPAHVKLVVSCLSDRATGDPAGQPYAELKRRQIPNENFINLGVLSESEARLLLFDRWLPKAGRKVSDDQRARIEDRLASPACRQPIYLKVLFEEVRLWHSYDLAPVPSESVSALLGQLFDRLCQPTNHGPLLVERALGYLASARCGLTETEVLEVLFADPEFRSALDTTTQRHRHELPVHASRIPIAIWSRLRFELGPYLVEHTAPGGNVLTFYHREVGEFAKSWIADRPGAKADHHGRLALYFIEQPLDIEDGKTANARRAFELPYQQTRARMWQELESTLSDLDFIEAKCRAGLGYDLIADYRRVGLARSLPASLCTTARDHAGHCGVQCPDCLAWIQIANSSLGHLLGCTHCRALLRLNPRTLPSAWQPSGPERRPLRQDLAERSLSDELSQWADFALSRMHVLTTHPECTFEEAHNWINGLAPTCAAADRWRGRQERRSWLRLLNRSSNREPLATASSPHASVCAVSPDGRFVAVAGPTLMLWDMETGTTIELPSPVAKAEWCGFSLDGRRLGVFGNNAASVMDVENRSMLHSITETRDLISAAWTPSGLLLASQSQIDDGRYDEYEIEVCDAVTQSRVGSVRTKQAAGCALSPDGRKLVVWRRLEEGWRYTHIRGCEVRLYDLPTGEELGRIEREAPAFPECVFSPDGQRIAMLDSYRAARFFSAESGDDIAMVYGDASVKQPSTVFPKWLMNNLIHASNSDLARTNHFKLEGTGQPVFVGGYNNSIQVLSGDCLASLTTVGRQQLEMTSCGWSQDGLRLLGVLSNQEVGVWDAETGERIGTCADSGSVARAAFLPDSDRIVALGGDGRLRIWNLAQLFLRGESRHYQSIGSCSFSADGRRVVTTSADRSMKVWDVASGGIVATVPHTRTVTAAAISGDGRRTISWSSRVGFVDDEGEYQIVEVKEWSEDQPENVDGGPCQRHECEVHLCVPLADGRRFLSMSFDGAQELWNDGQVSTLSERHRSTSVSGSVSFGGKFLACLTDTGIVNVRDLSTLAVRERHLSPEEGWALKACSPDGRSVVLKFDRQFWVWETEANSLRSIPCDGDDITCFSPDGTSFLAVSEGTLRVYDLRTFHCSAVIKRVPRLAWSSYLYDCRHIVGHCQDGTLRVWNLANPRTPAILPVEGSIQAVGVSPTGNAIAAGTSEGLLYLLCLEEPRAGSFDHEEYSSISPQVEVTFNVKAVTQWGDSILLTGSDQRLGGWNSTAGFRLSPRRYPVWSGRLLLPAAQAIDYKYLKRDSLGRSHWESGPNRSVITPSQGHFEVEDAFR